MKPYQFLLAVVIAPLITWPLTWVVLEIHKLLHA